MKKCFIHFLTLRNFMMNTFCSESRLVSYDMEVLRYHLCIRKGFESRIMVSHLSAPEL